MESIWAAVPSQPTFTAVQLLDMRVISTADDAGSITIRVGPDGAGEFTVDHPRCVGRVVVPCPGAEPWTIPDLAELNDEIIAMLEIRGLGDVGWGRGVMRRGRRIGSRRIYVERVRRNPVRQPPRFDGGGPPEGRWLGVNGLRSAWFFMLVRTTR